jgi:hypothetical protein
MNREKQFFLLSYSTIGHQCPSQKAIIFSLKSSILFQEREDG